MARSRIRFRPPGLKPWTKIGTLGPFRGRLGLQWVVAPIVLGAILLFVGWAFLTRSHAPRAPFVRVVSVAAVRAGSFGDEPAVRVSVQGRSLVIRLDADQLQAVDYPAGGGCYPWTVYRDWVYVDPADPGSCGASPIP
jgi:hypothetical protein